ncbi:MAG: uroporphyrinogen decarboxylase family protein [Armatimonadota bacterium]
MTRRDRLLATLRGEPVDRIAVNFYELGGVRPDPADPDPFNIYNDPSWLPLIDIVKNEIDIIRTVSPGVPVPNDSGIVLYETSEEGPSRFVRTIVETKGRTLTSLTRRDRDVYTTWTIEALLKDTDDLRAYLTLPDDLFQMKPNVEGLLAEEEQLGDKGLAMLDTGDPLCVAAQLFSMEDYLVIALTENDLFHALLQKAAAPLQDLTEQMARECPGRLWRIVGPEYATEPYLRPKLFEEYVARYTGPMVESVMRNGGIARLHCHGRIRSCLPIMADMGINALDPIEPPPHGDITLAEVRREYGKQMTLFGNLEVTDLENLPQDEFEVVVRRTVKEGTRGEGGGFVLMPTAAPYGRKLSDTTLANYRTMMRVVNEG